jgi:hypothetical protein
LEITVVTSAGSATFDLTNTGQWIESGGERLRVCGVDDLWEGKQDLGAALGDAQHERSAVAC